jgi:hypothetical protein
MTVWVKYIMQPTTQETIVHYQKALGQVIKTFQRFLNFINALDILLPCSASALSGAISSALS